MSTPNNTPSPLEIKALTALAERLALLEVQSDFVHWVRSQLPSMRAIEQALATSKADPSRRKVFVIVGEVGTAKSSLAHYLHTELHSPWAPWSPLNAADFSEGSGNDKKLAASLQLAPHGSLLLEHANQLPLYLHALVIDFLGLRQLPMASAPAQLSSSGPTTTTAPTKDRPLTQVFLTFNGSKEDLHEQQQNPGSLFHALATHSLSEVLFLPPLRERKADLSKWIRAYGEKQAKKLGRAFPGLAPEAHEQLRQGTWLGNESELEHALAQALLRHPGSEALPSSAFTLHPQTALQDSAHAGPLSTVQRPPAEAGSSNLLAGVGVAFIGQGAPSPGLGFIQEKRRWTLQFEQRYLKLLLQKHDGNVSAAAREAKLDRSNFLRLLRRHHLKAQPFRKAA